jgi:Tol biopolymer transport system component
VDASGGTARQLTNWPGSETEAVWSGDGANIYFVSDRDAKFGDIWRVPPSGGDPVRLTNDGTFGSGAITTRPGVADLFSGNLRVANSSSRVFARTDG